jgi:hypothetical protein
MKMTDYGVWVVGWIYDSDNPDDKRWYAEGDPAVIPSKDLDIAALGLEMFPLDYYVNGEYKGHFRVVIDASGNDPFELHVWDPVKNRYKHCCVCRRDNVWEKLRSTNIL